MESTNECGKQFSFGDYVLWFPKVNKSHLGIGNGLDLIEDNMCCQITFVLLVTIEKFETNPVLVNVNKLKPHKNMESKVPKKMNKCQYIGNRMQVQFKKTNSEKKEDDEGCKI